MKYLDYLEQKILLERLVIGLEEPVLVKGLGELQAKIDSGNGGYNVIHGKNFNQQGDVLMFTTHDSFGHEKKISAKIIDDIEVNMGGGNIEKRPVIELDIKFAGEDYKKIPFSVSDRSSNTNPILISKGFVENELEALIDVGAKNISNDGVDVVYGEGFLNKLAKSAVSGAKVAKNLAKGGSSLAKGAWDATKGIASGAKGLATGAAGAVSNVAKSATGALGKIGSGLANSANWLKGGDDVSLLSPVKGAMSVGKDLTTGAAGAVKDITKGAWDATKGLASGAKGLVAGTVGAVAALGGAAVIKAISNCAKKLANSESLGKIDQDHIRKQLNSLNWIEKYAKDENYITENTLIPNWTQNDFKNHPIIPVVSFTGKKGGVTGEFGGEKIKSIENLINRWNKEIKKAKTAVEELKQTSTSQEQNKTEEQEELCLHESLLILEDDEQQQNTDNTTEQQQNTDNTTQEQSTSESEFVKEFSRLKNFTLWFIPVSKSAQDAKDNLLNKFKDDNNIDATLKNCFYKDVSKGSFNDIISSLQKTLNETNMKMEGTYSGFFALCTGDYQNINEAKNRTIDYYDKNLVLLDNVQYQQAQAKQKAEEEQKFKDTENKLINEMGLSELKNDLIRILNNKSAINTVNNFIEKIKNETNYEDENVNELSTNVMNANNNSNDELEQIKNFINDGTLQKSIIRYYLHKIHEDKIYKAIQDDSIKTWNEFVKACTKLPMFNKPNQNQENKPVEQEEEDTWINDKLNYLRNEGII